MNSTGTESTANVTHRISLLHGNSIVHSQNYFVVGCWIANAVSSSHDPFVADERRTTDMTTEELQWGLPRPFAWKKIILQWHHMGATAAHTRREIDC